MSTVLYKLPSTSVTGVIKELRSVGGAEAVGCIGTVIVSSAVCKRGKVAGKCAGSRPSVVLLPAIVGPVDVPQHTPLAGIVPPPASVILPPAAAVVEVRLVATVVVRAAPVTVWW